LFGESGYDDGLARNTEVRWGDRNLEWIAFDACELLQRAGVFGRWGWPVFKGLHYVLGFHTTCSDEANRGRYFAEYLNDGWTVRNAWIKACQLTEGSTVEWAYLRAGTSSADTYNDHWHGKGYTSPDPLNPTYLAYGRGSC
jgi:hypothetical protein